MSAAPHARPSCSDHGRVRPPPHRPRRRRAGRACSPTLGVASLDELLDRAVPDAHPPARAARPARAAAPRPRCWPSCARIAGRNQVLTSPDRHGLLRHDHPAGDPAQRAREPGLVHGLHAVPARDQPGPARGAAQLPDDGRRPHRAGPGQRLAARRGHRRGRGDGDGPPPVEDADATASSSTPTPTRRRSPCCGPGPSRSASSSSSATSTTTRRRRPASARCSACPARPARVRRLAAADRRGPRRRRPRGRGHRPARAACCCTPPGDSAPTSSSARRSASACRWASAARTPPSSPPATRSPGRCPAASSA